MNDFRDWIKAILGVSTEGLMELEEDVKFHDRLESLLQKDSKDAIMIISKDDLNALKDVLEFALNMSIRELDWYEVEGEDWINELKQEQKRSTKIVELTTILEENLKND